MKKINFLFLSFASIIMLFASCGIEEKISKEVSIDVPDRIFDVKEIANNVQAIKGISGANSAIQVLYDGTIDVNVADKLAEQGLSINNIKTFALYQSTISIVPGDYTDANIDLNTFRDMKLYFDNTNASNLVASVQNVDAANGSITFKIENPNQLDKLNNNSIHLIITKETPPIHNVRFKLKMRFNMRVGL